MFMTVVRRTPSQKKRKVEFWETVHPMRPCQSYLYRLVNSISTMARTLRDSKSSTLPRKSRRSSFWWWFHRDVILKSAERLWMHCTSTFVEILMNTWAAKNDIISLSWSLRAFNSWPCVVFRSLIENWSEKAVSLWGREAESRVRATSMARMWMHTAVQAHSPISRQLGPTSSALIQSVLTPRCLSTSTSSCGAPSSPSSSSNRPDRRAFSSLAPQTGRRGQSGHFSLCVAGAFFSCQHRSVSPFGLGLRTMERASQISTGNRNSQLRQNIKFDFYVKCF